MSESNRIVSRWQDLSKGDVGKVHPATDTALKFFPDSFTGDPEGDLSIKNYRISGQAGADARRCEAGEKKGKEVA
jgi:hypothetical protein